MIRRVNLLLCDCCGAEFAGAEEAMAELHAKAQRKLFGDRGWKHWDSHDVCAQCWEVMVKSPKRTPVAFEERMREVAR